MKEMELLKRSGVYLENKEYTPEEIKRWEIEISEYIMNHSSKNGDISKLNLEYTTIYDKIKRYDS